MYKQVLELDGEDLHSLDKLSELYLKLGRWEDLMAAYAKKADIVSSPEDKKAIYSEIGAVYERELNDPARAIDTYQRILEVDPDDRSAIGRLDALYLATENWTELMSVLEREVDLTGDPYVRWATATASPSSGIRSSATPPVRSMASGKSWSSRLTTPKRWSLSRA